MTKEEFIEYLNKVAKTITEQLDGFKGRLSEEELTQLKLLNGFVGEVIDMSESIRSMDNLLKAYKEWD